MTPLEIIALFKRSYENGDAFNGTEAAAALAVWISRNKARLSELDCEWLILVGGAVFKEVTDSKRNYTMAANDEAGALIRQLRENER